VTLGEQCYRLGERQCRAFAVGEQRRLSLQGLGEYAHGVHTNPPALVVGYAKPPEHAYTAAVARLAAVLREATS